MVLFIVDEIKTSSSGNNIVLKDNEYDRVKKNIRLCSSVCNVIFKK